MERKQNKKNRKKKWLYISFIVLIILSITTYFGNQWAKKHGFKNLWDFLTTTGSNYSKSFNAQYEEIYIQISENDFKKLEKLREQALRRGIIVNNEDGEYVPADIIHDGKKIKSEIRLKGHMTDHLQENKWSFRVKTKKGDALMGMKRFSLQHPGTRNYVNEWIYHQLMESQGIISLRYMFVKVHVNDDDWGIYALEEHFAQELIQNNLRLPGPVIRYNPDLYWEHRMNEYNKIRITEEFANMQNAYIEAYETKNTLGDSSLRRDFISAMQLLEEFRRGKRTTSKTFDIVKLARFHAVIDIVGGHHSLDWSDVKYYYNPATQLLEPVAYESFGAQPAAKISGTYKFIDDSLNYHNDHHEMMFSDPEFFAVYISELNRLTKGSFLEKFFKDIDAQLQSNLAILYKEFPYKNFSSKIYFDNCKNIQKILDSPVGFYAHAMDFSDTSATLSIGAVESLPFEITGLKIDTFSISLKEKIIIPSKKAGTPVLYKNYIVPFGKIITDTGNKKIIVQYHLPGLDKKKEQEVFSYPPYNEKFAGFYMTQNENVKDFDFIVEENGVLTIKPGKHIVTKDLVIGKDKKLHVFEGTELVLNNNAKIISRSPVYFKGTEESPVIITTSDSTGQGIIISGVKERSEFIHVVFQSLAAPTWFKYSNEGALNFYESKASLDNCTFSLSRFAAVQASRSDINITNSLFKLSGKNAINLFFCRGEFNNLIIDECKNDGIKMNGSFVRISGMVAQKIKGSVVNAEEYSEAVITKSVIKEGGVGVESRDQSKVQVNNLSLENCETGFKAHKKGDVFGPAEIIVNGLKEKNTGKLKITEKGSKIEIK